jgi:hypothetical protein
MTEHVPSHSDKVHLSLATNYKLPEMTENMQELHSRISWEDRACWSKSIVLQLSIQESEDWNTNKAVLPLVSYASGTRSASAVGQQKARRWRIGHTWPVGRWQLCTGDLRDVAMIHIWIRMFWPVWRHERLKKGLVPYSQSFTGVTWVFWRTCPH